MVTHHDVVLAVVPLLAVSGMALSRAVVVLESTVGVGGRLAGIPFTALGLVCALGVIGRELLNPRFEGTG